MIDKNIALIAGPCASCLPSRIDPRFIIANQSEFEHLFVSPSLMVSPIYREVFSARR